MQPLENLRVLDVSRALAGPYCTMMLGDLGAEVIKVELPGSGDESRSWGPPFVGEPHGPYPGVSAYFISANRNKLSVTVNLKSAAGKEVLRRLVRISDVLVENFRTGDLAKLGLENEHIDLWFFTDRPHDTLNNVMTTMIKPRAYVIMHNAVGNDTKLKKTVEVYPDAIGFVGSSEKKIFIKK